MDLGVAIYYRYDDGSGEIGIIASVNQPFCWSCTRARLSAEGQVYTCLFGNRAWDLRQLLRRGDADIEIAAFLKDSWQRRQDRYSALRKVGTVSSDRIKMSRIGG